MRRALNYLATTVLILGLAACSSVDEASEAESIPSADADQTCLSAQPGQTAHTLTVNGEPRQFLVDIPPNYDANTLLPAVYVAHGLGGNANGIVEWSQFAALGADRSFITIAPQGLGAPPGWDFRTPASEPGSDAAFLQQLTEYVAASWCADPERQFMTGFSNGSALTFAAACWGNLGFAGYGGVAAAGFESDCATDGTQLIYFHGTADTVVPIDGGPTPLEDVAPLVEILDEWAEHLQCDPQATIDDTAANVEHSRWKGCSGDSRLESYVIEGGAHVWPSSPAASELMLDFFGI